MSEQTGIEWTDHTFNPWWGCTKIHDGCKNCYAETFDKRVGGKHWGPTAHRRMILGEWGKPAKWNDAAEERGVMARVFCASMADLFEAYHGQGVVDQRGSPVEAPMAMRARYGALMDRGAFWTIPALRHRVFDLIESTPWLDWLLLTKRPENVVDMVPHPWLGNWPTNVMVGTSPCNQATADACIPRLLEVPGRRFLSIEPMLGMVGIDHAGMRMDGIDWVIVGGESGPGARPCELRWIRAVVHQCRSAGVPCFVKQLGSRSTTTHIGDGCHMLQHKKGGDPSEWPEDLCVRQFPPRSNCRASAERDQGVMIKQSSSSRASAEPLQSGIACIMRP